MHAGDSEPRRGAASRRWSVWLRWALAVCLACFLVAALGIVGWLRWCRLPEGANLVTGALAPAAPEEQSVRLWFDPPTVAPHFARSVLIEADAKHVRLIVHSYGAILYDRTVDASAGWTARMVADLDAHRGEYFRRCPADEPDGGPRLSAELWAGESLRMRGMSMSCSRPISAAASAERWRGEARRLHASPALTKAEEPLKSEPKKKVRDDPCSAGCERASTAGRRGFRSVRPYCRCCCGG